MADEKVAIVTAASKGIGAATARELARRGYRLALLATSDAIHTIAKELDAIAVQGSVTVLDDLKRLVDATLQKHGRIDAVVNNTGGPPKGDLLSISDDDWRLGVDLVLLNTVRLARLVTPVMEQQKSGAIVSITSTVAKEPDLTFPVSSVLRAGVSAFTKLYAERYGPSRIRMNTIMPGFVDSYPEKEHLIAKIPMRRYGRREELAKTIAFLISDDAAYITGQNIAFDGGMMRTL